jgi:hypothetical protein
MKTLSMQWRSTSAAFGLETIAPGTGLLYSNGEFSLE